MCHVRGHCLIAYGLWPIYIWKSYIAALPIVTPSSEVSKFAGNPASSSHIGTICTYPLSEASSAHKSPSR